MTQGQTQGCRAAATRGPWRRRAPQAAGCTAYPAFRVQPRLSLLCRRAGLPSNTRLAPRWTPATVRLPHRRCRCRRRSRRRCAGEAVPSAPTARSPSQQGGRGRRQRLQAAATTRRATTPPTGAPEGCGSATRPAVCSGAAERGASTRRQGPSWCVQAPRPAPPRVHPLAGQRAGRGDGRPAGCRVLRGVAAGQGDLSSSTMASTTASPARARARRLRNGPIST